MRTSSLSMACAIALLLATGTSQAEPTHHKIKAVPVKHKLICRSPVRNGLLIARAKECHTQAEWDARQKRMQQSIEHYQRQNLLQNPR